MKFNGTYNQTSGINIANTLGEEFFDQFILTFLKTLYTKGHPTQTCNLLFSISQC